MDSLTTAPATPLGVDEPTLPFRFRAPAGWPEPSPDWLAANQAWEPPPGWTPAEGLNAAPDAWVFWERQEGGWARFASRIRRQHVRGVAIDIVLLAGGILLLETRSIDLGVARAVLWGVMIFSPIDLCCHVGHLFRMHSAIVDLARATSVADRRGGARSETAEWPSDENNDTGFTPRQSMLPLGWRLATMGLAGTLGALLILVIGWSTSGVPLVAL